MDQATDYQTWLEAARELDLRDGKEEWKEDEISDDYDWRLIRSRLRQIRQYRAAKDVSRLVYHLRQGLHWNLGNTGNTRLYSFCRVGTKHLIREYVTEVSDALTELCDTHFVEFEQEQKLKFFHEVALSYGRSALLLS